MIFSVKKNGFLGILGPPHCGIGATIRIGREMLCLPYSGFSPKEMWVRISKGLKHLNTVLHSCCPAVQYCEPRCQVATTRHSPSPQAVAGLLVAGAPACVQTGLTGWNTDRGSSQCSSVMGSCTSVSVNYPTQTR